MQTIRKPVNEKSPGSYKTVFGVQRVLAMYLHVYKEE